jgi:hypothetical protein
MWSDEEALHTHSYWSQNEERRDPITVMGDFVVYGNFRCYQWVSMKDTTGKGAIFEYAIPGHSIDWLHYIDHATGTLYLIFLFESSRAPL